MEKQPLLRRLYNRVFFEVQVDQWSPPFRTYTITVAVLSVALLIAILMQIFTDIPGLDLLAAFLFLTWLLAQRIWLRSILKQEGLLPPGQ